MIETGNQKVVAVTNPGAIVDNAEFSTAPVDTRGFRHVIVVAVLGALDVALSALKLRESDAADMSGATDVPGADFSAAPYLLPTANDDNKSYAIHIDMRGRKRFLDLTMTGGDGTAGTYASAFAVLSRGETSPSSADSRGYAAEIHA